MPNPPSGTVTFLFTDIEGSTKLAQQHPADWELARDRHHAILRAACEAQDGHVFQIIGDAFCVAFATAAAGLQAAIAAQHALQAEAWGETPIRVRMGLHTGSAEYAGSDYRGYLTLAQVQRVMSAGHGGQMLLSSATGGLLAAQLPDGVVLRDVGEHRLKGLLNPEHLWQVDAPGLAQDFPPLQTLNAIPNNLPIQVTSFVGREHELAELQRLLPGSRLLTLTGAGGTGKTRLALQVAAGVIDAHKDGVWFIELAPLANPALVPEAVAAVLGVREQPGQTILAALLNWMRARQLLLILDNCEHLIEACARFADAALHASREMRILASSREAFGIAGEQAFRVPSLQIPASSAAIPAVDLAQYEGVKLFVQRASAVRAGFAVTDANAATVAQICRRLDGIPLAIELAAARVRTLSIEQIAQRLDDSFRLLTGGSRTALPRQQTLRSLIDWSYALLGEPERAALRQFSVFAGGWSLEAAEAMCGRETLDLLTRLADKSLVSVDEQADGMRYRLLETIRQYARERLFEAHEGELARDRHLAFFLALAEAREPRLTGRDMIAALNELEAELDNVRAALSWALDTDPLAALRMMGVLCRFFGHRGSAAEGREWMRLALARAEALPALEGQAARPYLAAKARALAGAAAMAFGQGENAAAQTFAEASIALARGIGALRSLAWALGTGALAQAMLNHPESARAWLNEALELSRKHGFAYEQTIAMHALHMTAAFTQDPLHTQIYEEYQRLARDLGNPEALAVAVASAGRLASLHGSLSEASARFEEVERLTRLLHDERLTRISRSERAHVLRRQGRWADALALYRDTLRYWQENGYRAAVAYELENVAFIALAEKSTVRSATLLAAAGSLREAIHSAMMPLERMEYETQVSALRAQLAADAYAAAWAAGSAMTMDQAITYAVEDPDAQSA